MKSQVGALKYLLMLENYTNIHRDFIYFSKKKCLVTSFAILLEVFLISAVYTENLRQLLSELANRYHSLVIQYPLRLYLTILLQILFTSYGFSTVLFFGPRYGKAFSQILKFLDKGHRLAHQSPLYKNSIQKLTLKCYAVTLVFVLVRLTVGLTYCIGLILSTKSIPWDPHKQLFNFLYLVLRTWIEFRYVLITLMFYGIVHTLRCNISFLVFLIERCDDVSIEQLNTYSVIYQEHSTCCKQILLCFGVQIQLHIAIAVTQVTALMSNFIHLILTNTLVHISAPGILGVVTLFSWSAVAVAAAGQSVQNECDKLRISLSRLCCKASREPNSIRYKALQDLRRVVTVQPIAVSLAGTTARPVGMFVLPAALSLALHYVIVLLQFNNDV